MLFTFDQPCDLSEKERFDIIKWFIHRYDSVTVTFKKTDGTVRIMPCSLNEQYLPQISRISSSPSTSQVEDNSSILVWSLDKNGWRRFKTMNVMSVSNNV